MEKLDRIINEAITIIENGPEMGHGNPDADGMTPAPIDPEIKKMWHKDKPEMGHGNPDADGMTPAPTVVPEPETHVPTAFLKHIGTQADDAGLI